MSRKGPRGLTPEEAALWRKVTERTDPLHPDRPASAPRARPSISEMLRPTQIDPPALPSFRIGERHTDTALPHNLSPGLSDRLSQQPVKMDRKGFTQLKRGKMKPEARIDLHGMTLARAHPVLNDFIFDAHARGLRLVLVITGKGKDRDEPGPIPTRRGVLKHQVPHWLTTPPLSLMVLQVAEAHLKHGGTGAYYVYLRRRR